MRVNFGSSTYATKRTACRPEEILMRNTIDILNHRISIDKERLHIPGRQILSNTRCSTCKENISKSNCYVYLKNHNLLHSILYGIITLLRK